MARLDIGSGLAGAATGASTGSLFGTPGAAIGGVTGGLLGLFNTKKRQQPEQLNTMDPRQQQLYGQYADAIQGQGPMAGMFQYDPMQAQNMFDQTIARPAYRGFQQNIVPQITGQFRGMGLGNSSYAQGALGRAGRDVQEGLDARRSEYMYGQQQDQQKNLQSAINNILGAQTFAYQRPEGERSVIDQILRTMGPAAGEWLADYLRTQGRKNRGIGTETFPSTTGIKMPDFMQR